MRPKTLAQGPPPLTTAAADAALDAIDFIAAAVRGYDAIDVTDVVRPLWRRHLASWYPHLPPATRQWYADAPLMLAAIHTQWPLLLPMQQAVILQQWAMQLPHLLWMIDPVLAEAQEIEMAQATRVRIDQMRRDALSGIPADEDAEQNALDELARSRQTAAQLIDFSNTMTSLTISQMRAINRS